MPIQTIISNDQLKPGFDFMLSESHYDTRERILHSAARLFAEGGIHATTVKDICMAADANVAAVNYYFGSKDHLIEEVLDTAFSVMRRKHGVTDIDSLPARDRLRELVRSHLESVMDDGPGGWFPKIVFRVLSEFDRSEVKSIFERYISPRISVLMQTVRDLLGPDADEVDVRSCVLAIHSPCVHMNIVRRKGNGQIFHGVDPMLHREQIVQTLTAFVMGGVLACRRSSDEEGV
ncbi:MAG: TetR/AcrR family transcriptional regulator [Verrucomicrobiota bacterium]